MSPAVDPSHFPPLSIATSKPVKAPPQISQVSDPARPSSYTAVLRSVYPRASKKSFEDVGRTSSSLLSTTISQAFSTLRRRSLRHWMVSKSKKLEQVLVGTKFDEFVQLPLEMQWAIVNQIGEAQYRFEGRTIQRMELLVLTTLKWRMQSVTPFSFIDFFLHQFNDGNSPDRSLISVCVNLISSTVRGVGFVEFKPSEIAAAVALSAMKQTQVLDTDKALASCEYVDKERVLRCQELMVQEMGLLQHRPHKNNSAAISSVGYKSDDTAVRSHAICHHSSPTAKKSKPNNPSGS